MKKPAAAIMKKNNTKNDEESKALKRPAAAMGSVNKSLADMQRGSKKSKPAEDDGDRSNADNTSEKSDGEDHRDKGKAIKFRQMQKELPPHIIDLYEKEALNKSSPRAFRTQLINQLFTKLPSGRYRLNDDKPMFREAKQMYEKKYGSEKEKEYPKSVMKGLYFGNSDAHFERALADGEIYQMDHKGKVFYAFQSVEAGSVRLVGIVKSWNWNHCDVLDWHILVNIWSSEEREEDVGERMSEMLILREEVVVR